MHDNIGEGRDELYTSDLSKHGRVWWVDVTCIISEHRVVCACGICETEKLFGDVVMNILRGRPEA